MTSGNFLVTRESGFLSVVQNRNCRTKDKKVHAEKCIFNIAGNVEGLEEGKQCSKIVMLLYGWEKAGEA